MIALQRNWMWMAFVVLAMVFSGCVPLTPGAPGDPTATPAPPPTGGPGAEEIVVDRIEIVILESFPVQVHVVAYGQLPDACSFVQEATQARQDNAFDVELVVARRPDARCAPQPTPFTHTIALEVQGLKAGTYTVNVHGVTGAFKLEMDNGLPSAGEVALTWRREGGIAGFCDGLTVYQTGKTVATSCKGIAPGGQIEGQLAGERLQQLADWLGQFENFDVVQKDDATADAMVVQVVFYGHGATKATEADVQAIREFAAQVFQELASPQAPGESGVLATFDVDGEQFRVWVTNPQTIQQILELEQGKSMANIPNGRILRGPGYQDYNAPWSWHLDPQEIEMAEFTMEVCDGRPSYVEEHVDEFVDVMGRYCPWAAKLVDVQDMR
jgi:hypothetical protein